jgi:hypothetical protein
MGDVLEFWIQCRCSKWSPSASKHCHNLFQKYWWVKSVRTTVGRTSLDEWSARRRDLYLTTHDIRNRQISMPRWDSNPRSQQVSGRKQHTTLTTDKYPCPGGIRTQDLSRWAAAGRSPSEIVYDISSLRVNDLTLILLTWRKSWANNVRK